MNSRAEVFEQTYQGYLQQINAIDYLSKADILGLEKKGTKLIIPFYNKLYFCGGDGIVADGGREASVPVRVILSKYILFCSGQQHKFQNRPQPFRDFKDAAPLISYFASNCTLCLEKAFTGSLEKLEERCLLIGGREIVSEVYDLSMQFNALPRITVILNFNDRDELFPAACSILFNSSAEHYLDMECLAMTGTYLTEILTKET